MQICLFVIPASVAAESSSERPNTFQTNLDKPTGCLQRVPNSGRYLDDEFNAISFQRGDATLPDAVQSKQ